jgi:hypothetical protein
MYVRLGGKGMALLERSRCDHDMVAGGLFHRRHPKVRLDDSRVLVRKCVNLSNNEVCSLRMPMLICYIAYHANTRAIHR